jgi:hypothetical protein
VRKTTTAEMDLMKKTIISAMLMSVLLLVGACTAHRYTVVEPDSESRELAARFADKLHQNIMKNRGEHPDKVIFDEVVRETDKIEGVLLLDGTLISFEKGSRAARFFFGFGAGKAYCTIQSIFTDKMTKEPILKLNFDGELSKGFFGGSADNAVQGVVEAYLDYFDDYFENQAGNK